MKINFNFASSWVEEFSPAAQPLIMETGLTPTPLQASDGAGIFSLTLLPELESHITNYTCKAQNTFGQNRATVSLTGCHLQSTE